MKLYDYFRSSAAYRVRIALNLKGLEYQQVPVNLLKSEQLSAEYEKVNPANLVPVLDTGQKTLNQSLAIIEWLEEEYPQPPLLPCDSWQKACVRAAAYDIACDIHPLNNSRVIAHLTDKFSVENPKGDSWYHHWIEKGFHALEQKVEANPFCFGENPSLADICLVPQVYNALRFGVDLSSFPKIQSIWEHSSTYEAFLRALPENQPDCSA